MNSLKLSMKTYTSIPKNLIFNRNNSSTAKSLNQFEISPTFVNRNPRNLEKLRIGYKPDGYHLEKPGRIFWHKVVLNESTKYATASIKHFKNGDVITASTQEWALKKHLYRYNDVSAYMNLGRVLAERCLKAGVTEVSCFLEPSDPQGRVANFLKALEEGGLVLKEPPQYKPARPWDQYRPEKPWEVLD